MEKLRQKKYNQVRTRAEIRVLACHTPTGHARGIDILPIKLPSQQTRHEPLSLSFSLSLSVSLFEHHSQFAVAIALIFHAATSLCLSPIRLVLGCRTSGIGRSCSQDPSHGAVNSFRGTPMWHIKGRFTHKAVLVPLCFINIYDDAGAER